MITYHRVRLRAVALGAAALAAQLTVGVALAAPGVTPSSVSDTLVPGASLIVEKTVETPPIPADPDIVFLADTTSSMSGAIGNVQANASTIMGSVLADAPTATFGVAHYTDQACPGPFVLDQALTADTLAVQAALDALTTPNFGCNSDAPEDYINALYQLATDPPVGFRAGSTRIVVLFGDSSSHDPSVGITEATATAALVAAGVRVLAVNVPGTFGYLYDGLDFTGQASRITAATDGIYLSAASVGAISDTILSGLMDLPVTVTPSATCDAGLSVAFAPTELIVASGDPAVFSETITVDAGHPGGATLYCTVDWLLDGESAGEAFVQEISIEVPGADLAIEKTGPDLVTEGEVFGYQLTVSNDGPATATGVVVTDTLPAATSFMSASVGCSEASGTVTCTIGSLAAGASVAWTITVRAGSAGGALENTATVSAHQYDPDPTDDSSTVVTVLNHDPTCDEVTAGEDLWPPNHKMILRTLTGALDVDGDTLTTTVLGVTQDEPLDDRADGKTEPDAQAGPADDQVFLRAERSGRGDGRVYRIDFHVVDGRGGSCSGTVFLGVPHDQRGDLAVDSGETFVDF